MPLVEPNLYHFSGIIIKKNSFGEGHASFTILDREKGKIEIFSFGSDREKSRRRSILIVPNLIEGVIYKSRNFDYFSIKEVSLKKDFSNITSNLEKAAYLFLALEIIDNFVATGFEASLPVTFSNTLNFLKKIEAQNDVEKYAFFLIFNLLNTEGILPDFTTEDALETFTKELNIRNFSLGSGARKFVVDILKIKDINLLDNKKVSNSVIINLLELVSLIVKAEKDIELSSLSIIPLK
ncbi:MAG: DNA repair protein RecO [Brevinematia bacterium]